MRTEKPSEYLLLQLSCALRALNSSEHSSNQNIEHV